MTYSAPVARPDAGGESVDVAVAPDSASMARAAADAAAAILRSSVARSGVAHAMFATGNSQLDFVGALVGETPDVPWNDVVVFHMDEYVGIGEDHPASFQRWIRERIVAPAHPRAAHYLDGLADPDHECARYADLLARHPLDLCCLGIGENGHLAFNDPPTADFDDPLDVKEVVLDRACRLQQVGEGHFPTESDVPESALTVTIPALLRGGPGAGDRSRGTQGTAGTGRARRSGHHRVPCLDPATHPARNGLPRRRLGGALVGGARSVARPEPAVEERVGHRAVPLVLAFEHVVRQPIPR